MVDNTNEKEVHLKEISRRNTQMVEQALVQQNEKIYNMQEQINSQHLQIVNLTSQVEDLKQKFVIQKVQMTGVGPSVV